MNFLNCIITFESIVAGVVGLVFGFAATIYAMHLMYNREYKHLSRALAFPSIPGASANGIGIYFFNMSYCSIAVFILAYCLPILLPLCIEVKRNFPEFMNRGAYETPDQSKFIRKKKEK